MQAPDLDWTDLAKVATGACATILVAAIRAKTSFATAVAAEARKATEAALASYRDQLAAFAAQNARLSDKIDERDEEIIELRQALDALKERERG